MIERDESIEWRKIPGFPGYEISEYGDVTSHWKMDRHDKNPISKKPLRLLKPYLSTNGSYPSVSLRCGNNMTTCKRIYQLVALAFLGNKPDGVRTGGVQIAHKDCDKKNNHYSNLKYCTPKENMADSLRDGLHSHGESHGRSKLKSKEVALIKRLLNYEVSITIISKMFKVTRGAVYGIKRNVNWKHVEAF